MMITVNLELGNFDFDFVVQNSDQPTNNRNMFGTTTVRI